MGTPLAVWQRLSDRQKLAVAAVGGWAGAWLVGRVLDAISANVPGSVLLAMIAHFIESYVMNRLVIGLLIGAVLVTFGPNVWLWLKKAGPTGAFNLIIGTFLICILSLVAVLLGEDIYSSIVDIPLAYAPPPSALKNADGSIREFTHDSPRDLENLFGSNTELMARRLLHSEFGKWIAVTGALREVSVPDYAPGGMILLRMGSIHDGAPTAQLMFDKKWLWPLSNIPRGSHVFAVCKLSDVDSHSMRLNACEIAPP